ncbi:glycosyltransferase [Paracoccus alkanivorans]|uniref:Glycosyltransferase n=1 Tax=Paracoccus alkanivorans TaxID=2116655 RepID=A0A3M0M691_9RHOB|nr:glycosyltransferase [Paracoccus alkanivorans]RMC33282.1 glycosyltransferase [Paracoccus alkanivorans]
MRGKTGCHYQDTAAMPSHRSDHVTILLASYQGAAYLGQQLISLARQTHTEWSLIVSDDGSTDGTREIVMEFAAGQPEGRVRLIEGPRAGATQNFLHLLDAAPDGAMVGFCDQDDVWLSDKLARAVAFLRSHDGPAHYAARTLICDDNLALLTESRRFSRPLGFRNALVQACMAGNSSVFNAPAAALLKSALPAARAVRILSHDWWAYQVTAGAGGALFHDPHPVLHYRQHGRSEVGRNDTIRAMGSRLVQLFTGDYGMWLAVNHTALQGARPLLTAGNREILDRFGEALREPGPIAARRLWELGLYRQTRPGTVAFYAAAASGRLSKSPYGLDTGGATG